MVKWTILFWKKKEGTFEDDNELTTWVEYWKDAELVHRSAHVTLKKSPLADLVAATMA